MFLCVWNTNVIRMKQIQSKDGVVLYHSENKLGVGKSDISGLYVDAANGSEETLDLVFYFNVQ